MNISEESSVAAEPDCNWIITHPAENTDQIHQTPTDRP